MSQKKKEKTIPSDKENAFDFSDQMGLFPEDVPFGRNIGCGGKSTKNDIQKPKNQENKS
ncbi:hypothetical protein OU792_09475 [Algoriphagus sp. NF]|uniref:Uncharacterized protein n=1 Tax=Algoriphagus marincola TaxID=264027 RepID=A0ABS7N6M4_9BACT|nr:MULTISPECIES: hypothetical protein [Algoriphagus]MBY5951986.1 hypothetical protein [Algoriphagus marincola]MDE0560213.1 hypothetical protein [Algoriphagus sp. NF]